MTGWGARSTVFPKNLDGMEEAMSAGAHVAILLGSIAFVLIVISVLVRPVGERPAG